MTATAAPNARAVERFLGGRRRARRRRTVMDQLYRVYVGAFFVGIPLWWLWTTLDEVVERLPPAEASWLLGPLPGVLAAVMLAATVGALRLATWQGPVILSKPDVTWLLAAPIPRRALLVGPLRRGLLAAALVSATVGLLVAGALAVRLAVPVLPLLLAGAAAGAGWGLCAAAAAWFVECDPRRARLVLRASLPVVGVAALLGAVVVGASGEPADVATAIALWSGPWGWAVAPVVAAAGAVVPGWPLAATCLSLLAGGLVVAADRRAGAAPVEELSRRAGVNTSFRAALFFADLRSAARARRDATRALRGVSRRHLRAPRSRWLAVPWRDLVVLRREPSRVVTAAIAVALATVGVATPAVRRLGTTTELDVAGLLMLAGVAFAAYLAASALVEPLRAEPEQRFADHHLPWPVHTVARLHVVTPLAVLALAGLVALAVLAASGAVPLTAVPAAAVVVVLGAVTLSACAAASAVAPNPDPSLLFAGEGAAQLFFVQLLLGPQVAAIAVALPAVIAVNAVGSGASVGAVLAGAAGWTAFVVVAADAWLRFRAPRQ